MVIGTPTANRGRAEIENLIGFFVNTLAVRLDLSGRPSVSELLARVMAQAITAQQHQDIPFEQVVELARPVRSLAHSPLFQVMFAWQNKQGEFNLPGLELVPLTRPFTDLPSSTSPSFCRRPVRPSSAESSMPHRSSNRLRSNATWDIPQPA